MFSKTTKSRGTSKDRRESASHIISASADSPIFLIDRMMLELTENGIKGNNKGEPNSDTCLNDDRECVAKVPEFLIHGCGTFGIASYAGDDIDDTTRES